MLQRAALAQWIRETSKIRGTFRLRSGRVSDTYFDKYLFESDPALLLAIVDHMRALVPKETQILCGLEMGGIPVVTMLSQVTGIPAAFIRKERKTYGTEKYAEGPPLAGKAVVLIEDVRRKHTGHPPFHPTKPTHRRRRAQGTCAYRINIEPFKRHRTIRGIWRCADERDIWEVDRHQGMPIQPVAAPSNATTPGSRRGAVLTCRRARKAYRIRSSAGRYNTPTPDAAHRAATGSLRGSLRSLERHRT